MFSVVIPLYNKCDYIEAAVESVLNQSFKEFELIVVNDGSTDGSDTVVSIYTDPRIKLINKANGGVSSARNSGIKSAKFNWIAFLDADDFWESDHLQELQRLSILFPSASVLLTGFAPFHTHNDQQTNHIVNDYFLEAIKNPIICSSNVAIKSACFNEVGFFNEQLNRGEDIDMWYKLAKKYQLARSRRITSNYRQVNNDSAALANYDFNKSFLSTIKISDVKSESEFKYLLYIISVVLRRGYRSRNFTLIKKMIGRFKFMLLSGAFLKLLFKNRLKSNV